MAASGRGARKTRRRKPLGAAIETAVRVLKTSGEDRHPVPYKVPGHGENTFISAAEEASTQ